MVTRSLCLCVYSPGCRSLGHPGCRCFSGSLPRSASCFMRSYCISHRVTYLLFLSHTLIHAHTHTHTLRFSWVWLLLFPQVSFSQPIPYWSFASSFFSFYFLLHVADTFFFSVGAFSVYQSTHVRLKLCLSNDTWLGRSIFHMININKYFKIHCKFCISNSLNMFTEKVLSQLQTQGCIPDSLPRSCLFPSVHHAVQHCLTILPRSLEVRTIYIYI